MEKKYIWMGLGVIVFFVLALIIFFLFKSSGNRQAVTSFPLSTPMMLATAISSPTATVVPALPGNIWVVMQIEENAIYANGFYYDVATFSNLDQPSLIIRAQCMNPGWPSPKIGHQFVLIYSAVLVPIEGVESKIQRFQVLDP